MFDKPTRMHGERMATHLSQARKWQVSRFDKRPSVEVVVEDSYREKELVEEIEAIDSKAKKRKEK